MVIRKFIRPAILCVIFTAAIFFTARVVFSTPNKNSTKETPIEAAAANTRITDIATPPPVKAVNVSERKKYPYIMIDPGHGGIDYGTVSGNVFEKAVNLDVANRLKKSLSNIGYKVLMTRNRDIFLAGSSNIRGTLEKKDLDARIKLLNSSNASLFISLHVDSDPSQPQRNGSTVYYNPYISGSEKLAEILQSELNKVTLNGMNRASNTSCSADFYILRNANITGVLVETGFITNKTEKEGFMQEKFKTDLADAISNGIKKYNKSPINLANIKNESVR